MPKTVESLLGPVTREFNRRQSQLRTTLEPDTEKLRRIHGEFQDTIVKLVGDYRATGNPETAELGKQFVDEYATWVELHDPAFNDSPAYFAATYRLGMVPQLKAHFGEK